MTGREAAEAAVTASGAVVLGERVDPARGRRTPLSEGAVIGAASGLALGGRRVVVELVDPAGVARAADALADAGSVAARSGGAWTAPVVVRVPVGPADTLPAVPEGVATVLVGRADGLGPAIAGALAANGPTVVFEARSALEGSLGAEGLPAGEDVVVLAFGEGVAVATEAAAALAGERGVAVVELGAPTVDAAAGAAVRRAGRVVVVGHGGVDLSGSVVSAAFWSLEAPPITVRAHAGVDAVVTAIRSTFEE